MKRYSILLVAALFGTQYLSAQGVTFYSEEFGLAVRAQLNLEETASVTASQLEAITELDLSDLELTDIRDLTYCPKIRQLNLEGNKLENVALLANLDSLREVNLSHNQLESINELVFSRSPEMMVDVAFNYIQDFSCFNTLTNCCFTIEGTSFQSVKNAPYYDVREFYTNLMAKDTPHVYYRGYTNMTAKSSLRIAETTTEAVIDGELHDVAVSGDNDSPTKIVLTNGEQEVVTYAITPQYFEVAGGKLLTIDTQLPDNYQFGMVYARHGTAIASGSVILYTAPATPVPDIIYFYIYQGTDLRLIAYHYVNVSGDVNGDHVVNAADVMQAVKLMNTGEYNSAADMNGNGTIDQADVEAIARMILLAE